MIFYWAHAPQNIHLPRLQIDFTFCFIIKKIVNTFWKKHVGNNQEVTSNRPDEDVDANAPNSSLPPLSNFVKQILPQRERKNNIYGAQ